MSKQVLEGIRVVDFTWVFAGPSATLMLADMGAEVIKIESHRHIDQLRTVPVFAEGKPGVNRASGFNTLNRGKKSCTLNSTQPKAVEIVKKIVKISDVVIDNFPPRVMKGFGLDYSALREVKPDIIVVSLPGFGAAGPDKDYVSWAPIIEAVSGLTSTAGYPDGPPLGAGVYYVDPLAGLYAIIAVLSALFYRRETGKGQYIDISQQEAAITILPEAIMEYTMNGRIRPRMGNRDDIMAPCGCYQCKGDDKWVTIAVSNDQEWEAFCDAIGNPDWSKDERFSDQFSRWQNQDELDKLIGDWTRDRTHYEVMRTLQERGVAAGPSFNIEELINDPHIKERGVFVEVDHPEVGKRIVYNTPLKLSATPCQISGPAPLLGEHNEYVFKDLLGMSDREISDLVEEGVIY